MNQINLIRQTLRPHLSWHGARVTFLALFLVALVRVRTVNFVEVAQGFMGTAKAESSEKRLHRFFSEFDIDYPEIARLVAVATCGIGAETSGGSWAEADETNPHPPAHQDS
jgi:hypothetical protein